MARPTRRERAVARIIQPRSSTTGAPRPIVERSLDGLLAMQRPSVLAHLRRIRRKYPHATPEQIIRVLETRYIATVTAGGAGVGAAAVIPAVGTGIALGLAGAETLGFVEATALFAHSVAEVHGITVTDRERTRALVLALMLGNEGADLVRQVTMQAVGGGGSRRDYWGKMLTSAVPRYAMGPLLDRLKKSFMHRLAGVGGASVVGKALPFGVGAVVGGTGNHLLARRVTKASRQAFGPPPLTLPVELEFTPGPFASEHPEAQPAPGAAPAPEAQPAPGAAPAPEAPRYAPPVVPSPPRYAPPVPDGNGASGDGAPSGGAAGGSGSGPAYDITSLPRTP
ncbi:hypothetical protein [Leucobacter chromiiresistens]|uniref:hypothetical protein n=1 Tax=Leucobacter chromiiresistens TaxID=1079994 RepID=UPI0007341754|nr:hypothetical protein [Leucobacter chromiiresistens]